MPPCALRTLCCWLLLHGHRRKGQWMRMLPCRCLSTRLKLFSPLPRLPCHCCGAAPACCRASLHTWRSMQCSRPAAAATPRPSSRHLPPREFWGAPECLLLLATATLAKPPTCSIWQSASFSELNAWALCYAAPFPRSPAVPPTYYPVAIGSRTAATTATVIRNGTAGGSGGTSTATAAVQPATVTSQPATTTGPTTPTTQAAQPANNQGSNSNNNNVVIPGLPTTDIQSVLRGVIFSSGPNPLVAAQQAAAQAAAQQAGAAQSGGQATGNPTVQPVATTAGTNIGGTTAAVSGGG